MMTRTSVVYSFKQGGLLLIINAKGVDIIDLRNNKELDNERILFGLQNNSSWLI